MELRPPPEGNLPGPLQEKLLPTQPSPMRSITPPDTSHSRRLTINPPIAPIFWINNLLSTAPSPLSTWLPCLVKPMLWLTKTNQLMPLWTSSPPFSGINDLLSTEPSFLIDMTTMPNKAPASVDMNQSTHAPLNVIIAQPSLLLMSLWSSIISSPKIVKTDTKQEAHYTSSHFPGPEHR